MTKDQLARAKVAVERLNAEAEKTTSPARREALIAAKNRIINHMLLKLGEQKLVAE